ncbi:DNA polymerase I [Peptoniphilus equinus]|uniref:DNA polymerase I n=1 Tax=Peptoniphilus equinus TaxID=3016343 RepID=A0ABY7QSP5_9FIRM|nr:DNA polymerase I [Peptoniphilus equinus]WBW49351.1 DNA polymerase I [Peptoniphilus equinus]
MGKILIIDGSSLFFRAFYALPLLKTKRGIYTNALYGFVQMLENAIDKIAPTHVVVCFDMKGKTFRSEIFKDYKGTRQKTPSELEQQFPLVREVLKRMNMPVLESPVYEADDIAGTLSKMAEDAGMQSILLTGDKDYFQLVSPKTQVLLTRKGITEMDVVDVAYLRDEYDLEPGQFIDLKALMGDASDNIPGVPGIGIKTGLKLIHEYTTLENLYDSLEGMKATKQKEKLVENKIQAFMSKKLGTIVRTVPLDVSLEDLQRQAYDYDTLADLYREYELTTLLHRLPEAYQKEEINAVSEDVLKVRDVQPDQLAAEIQRAGSFAFHFITDGKIYRGVTPLLLGVKVKDMAPTVLTFSETMLQTLKPVFEDGSIEKLGHGIKEDLLILMYYGVAIAGLVHDGEIAAYLLNATQSNYDIAHVAQQYLATTFKDEEELLGKGAKRKAFGDLADDELSDYLAFYLNACYQLYEVQHDKLEEQGMHELYNKVELPLAEVLASMELVGIHTDVAVLDAIGADLEAKIEALTTSIHKQAGETFNIGSPKQLGTVLFEKMGLPVMKKTKTGYSTSVEVLEKLVEADPIIADILAYRKFTKLKSTYVDGLRAIINPLTGRIHSNFNQTVAATGRISSQDPNLQNIPIKNEEGRLIRKAFLASDGCKLVDADYSQIELRVLAAITGDEHMIQAFNEGIDIHRKTASEVFKRPLDEVTSHERSQAKAVNFGIVYGISDYGLSQNLNIPRKVAKEYIDNYLDNFKGIKAYMTDEVAEAKKRGYVETILHRRRYIPELSAKNFNIRQFGERVAINMPIQGSAADIIKIAMVKVYARLKKQQMKSRLILQIHDELVVDAAADEVEAVKTLMHELMEHAVDMDVELLIDMNVGDNLYETK